MRLDSTLRQDESRVRWGGKVARRFEALNCSACNRLALMKWSCVLPVAAASKIDQRLLCLVLVAPPPPPPPPRPRPSLSLRRVLSTSVKTPAKLVSLIKWICELRLPGGSSSLWAGWVTTPRSHRPVLVELKLDQLAVVFTARNGSKIASQAGCNSSLIVLPTQPISVAHRPLFIA